MKGNLQPAPHPARLLLSFVILSLALATIAILVWQSRRPSTPPPNLTRAAPLPPANLPRPLPDFSLVDTSGRPVRRSDLLGHAVVFNFVFTSCSLNCRAVNRRMTEIQNATAELPEVLLVSFSIDPRTDTPTALDTFAKEFGADLRRWRFLTGGSAPTNAANTTRWIANVEDWIPLVPEGSLGTERILVADRDGVVRESFDGLHPDVSRKVIQWLRQQRSASSASSTPPTHPPRLGSLVPRPSPQP